MSHPAPKSRPLVVQKYGGSSLATPEKVLQAAQAIYRAYLKQQNLIVVVSAMGTTTNELIRLAHQVSATPNRRELDMLLTAGERMSMSLISMALHDLHCPAISFTGSQAGILTDGSHNNARIQELRPHRIEEALTQGRPVILAGFQGVYPETKEVTTLGRGGSDTTAVAMAAHFGAERCEMLKDVKGVYSADPQIVPTAKPWPELTYDTLIEMTYWGAKVLHHRAVELAKKLHVSLSVGWAQDPESRTFIKSEISMVEIGKVLSVNSLSQVLVFLMPHCSNVAQALTEFEAFLKKQDRPWPQILESSVQDHQTHLWITAPEEDLRALKELTKDQKEITLSPSTWSAVTTTCHGVAGSDLPARVSHQLEQAQIQVERLINSPLSVTALVPAHQREKAIQALHRLVENEA